MKDRQVRNPESYPVVVGKFSHMLSGERNFGVFSPNGTLWSCYPMTKESAQAQADRINKNVEGKL